MSIMNNCMYSDKDLDDAIKAERNRIREEIRQCIENGIIKVQQGSNKLFEIIN